MKKVVRKQQRKQRTSRVRARAKRESKALVSKSAAERFPFRWAVETRAATSKDAERANYYSNRVSQAGVTTHYVDEVLEIDSVDLWLLPTQLRALADYYERIRIRAGSDEGAVVIIGRRHGGLHDEEGQ